MIHIKLYFEYTLYVNYIKDVIIMNKKIYQILKKLVLLYQYYQYSSLYLLYQLLVIT